jgi:hypothetical protein
LDPLNRIRVTPRTGRLVEIADILDVTHQRASRIAAERG